MDRVLGAIWRPIKHFYQYHIHMIWRHQIQNQKPIIIYQPGKVGSSTIYESLEALRAFPVYQIHYLNPKRIDALTKTLQNSGEKISSHLHEGRALYRLIVQTNKPAQIIVLVRDPIARNLSDFFQNFRVMTGRTLSEGLSVDELSQLYLEIMQRQRFWGWYDNELAQMLGIDVYAQPFPQDKGSLRWQSGQYDVLLMRIETDDKQIEAALADFTGYSSIRLLETNRGDAKGYRDVYRDMKNSIRLPHDYLQSTLNTKYALHFYTDTERDSIYQRWVDHQTLPSN